MHTEKHDRSLTHGGRHFAIRLYRDGTVQGAPCWHSIIIEDGLPLRHGLASGTDVDGCVDAAVRFATEFVDAASSKS